MNATYNGQVLQLDEPLDLEPNTRVRVSIEPIEPKLGEPYSFLDFLASLELRGPTDWSERIEDYSEGFPQDAPNLS
ncbi:MAG: hypothetical protein HY741_29255 [Chloroflexi bacterium]|nr:hypothetical protein [Chloroflexota bacterium]